jgi:hypothetical protein
VDGSEVSDQLVQREFGGEPLYVGFGEPQKWADLETVIPGLPGVELDLTAVVGFGFGPRRQVVGIPLVSIFWDGFQLFVRVPVQRG